MSFENKKKIVWTISGSDSGGGAGIQSDLHTFHDFGVHGCSVITALTAQNSFALGYTVATERKNVVAQINALDSDLPANAIKIGMLANAEIIETVVKYLDDYEDYDGFVVCDPVMSASTGGSLLEESAGKVLVEQLFPRVDLLTPNIPEATAITGIAIETPEDIIKAAKQLITLGARSVLITGGHFKALNGKCVDYWADGKESFWLVGEHIQSVHNQGSGCTLSATIAAAIARGFDLTDAMVLAKAYVTQGIRSARQVGGGPGPVGHFGWPTDENDFPQLYKNFGQFIGSDNSSLEQGDMIDRAEWVDKFSLTEK
jgi:hydroxymethylpyrimidine kinase/phosphomethylpyrimidine kinase/thiamine-phosphate diphosphorylase